MSEAAVHEILVVDDEPNIRRTLSVHFETRGHRVTSAANVAEALSAVAERRFDLVFLDIRLGTDNGLDLLGRLIAEHPDLKVVVITAYASVETAVEAMKRGAKDYLPKPFSPAQLDLIVEKLAAVGRLEQRVAMLEGELARAEPEAELVAASAAMRSAVETARQAASSDGRILFRGESGTGKGVLAKAVHDWSARREKPFVVISCPAIPADLLESELFGHARGAFTGATRDNAGRVALAEGGTLLLDEVGDLPLPLQPKLLRFIQDGVYERLGNPSPRRADVRILAATNRNLEQAVAEGRFREDLFYRLNVLTLEVPSLRERREDIPPLAEHFLGFFARRDHKPSLRFAPDALDWLTGRAWPGNVRELRNTVERATMLARGDEIGVDLLGGKSLPPGEMALGDLRPLSDVEREHIRRVIARAPSLKEAAEILGIDQATLWRKRKEIEG